MTRKKKEKDVFDNLKLEQLLRAVGYAVARALKLPTMPVDESIPDIMKDRLAGGSTDPKANLHRASWHRFLDQLSKPELIDLAFGLAYDCPTKRDPFDKLGEQIDHTLIARPPDLSGAWGACRESDFSLRVGPPTDCIIRK